eukprot:Skav228357  [mRNA]  locus=scaffold5397:76369:81551:- [translate_table: standard]
MPRGAREDFREVWVNTDLEDLVCDMVNEVNDEDDSNTSDEDDNRTIEPDSDSDEIEELGWRSFQVISSADAPIFVGNAVPLDKVPIGTMVGRTEAQLIKLGKAGKSRHLGRTPHVRGSAKNACDHAHGGGEGRSPIGHKHPKTKFGKH